MSSGEVFIEQEKEELRARLKDQIFSIWRNNKANKYELGKHLFTLQELHAKRGSGTFLQDLAELDIPSNTAYQRIKFYKHIEAKWEAEQDPDLYPVRSSYRNGKNDDSRFPVEEVEHGEDLEAAADRKQERIEQIIKDEAEKLAKLQKDKVPRLTITLFFSKEDRARFRDKWDALDDKKRTDLVYEAIINAR
jgi:hypothetical protein